MVSAHRSMSLMALAMVLGCFEGRVPLDLPRRCEVTSECGADDVCFLERCVPRTNPCVVVVDEVASPVADGNGCGDDDICVAGVCQAPRCGDGVVTLSTGETCDGTHGCAADLCRFCGDGLVDEALGEACDDGEANSDGVSGACRSDCRAARCGDGVVDPGEGCDDGLSNSDIAPAACRSSCAPAGCGDGAVDPGEACDDGAANALLPDRCRPTCAVATCGDGVIDSGEVCDDGTANSDVRADACRRDCTAPRCGDGTVDLGEACDDGTLNSDARADACRADCRAPRCGDGVVDTSEACDDAVANADGVADACRRDCSAPSCGDGTLDTGEACDDGEANSDTQPGRCRLDCQPAHCGDGVVDLDEACDDGSLNNDEQSGACRTTCALATCGDGVIDPGERCDAGPANSDVVPDACRTRCLPARCGDGTIDGTEVCDDGVGNSDLRVGACRSDCRPARCGDGVTDLDEACDDGVFNDDVAPDACRTDCQAAGCGDGVIDGGEACDDGGESGGDGCSADCRKVERCGDLVVDDGEDCDDGNGNSGDGCAACRAQRFVAGLIIGGDVEGDLPAVARGLTAPTDVDVDDEGRIHVALPGGGIISRIEADGTMTTIAGTGIRGFPTDGARATTSALKFPIGLAIDRRGELIVADQEDGRVSRVDGSGRVHFLAGVGASLIGADSFDARLTATTPNSVAVDGLGRIYLVGLDDRLRRIDLDGRITTLVGQGGVSAFNGDGVGTAVQLNNPGGVDVDLQGRVLIADTGNHAVRLVDTDGTVRTVAGQGGVSGFTGDTGLATDALLDTPNAVLFIPGGGFFIADANNHRIRRVDADGVITTVVGTGSRFFNGDGADPLATAVVLPSGMAFDDEDGLVFADQGTNRIRRLDRDGSLRTIAGNGSPPTGGEGRPATETRLNLVSGLARDTQGRLLLVDQAFGLLHRIAPDGRIERLAGAPGGGLDRGFGGDGGPARDAVFGRLKAVLGLPDGGIVVTDGDNHRLRRIDEATGIVSTIVGTGQAGFDDDGPAAGRRIGNPDGLALRSDGGIVFGDRLNNLVRELRPDGLLVTLVGVRPPDQVPPGGAFNGDGLPALQTRLRLPSAFVFDAQSRLVFSDTLNHRVRRLEPDGTVVTIAGRGENASDGDGLLATAAAISEPGDLGFDGAGNLYITSFPGNVVRRVGTNGIIATVAGTGSPFPVFSNDLAQPDGDGGRAVDASLGGPRGLVVEQDGGFLFCDGRFNVVRQVDAAGRIDTVAGIIHPPVSGIGRQSALPDARALSLVQGLGFVAGGRLGRLFALDVTGPAVVGLAAGYSAVLGPEPADRASLHPFDEVAGVAFDGDRLFVSDLGAGEVLEIDRVDPQRPSTWTVSALAVPVRAPAGLALDGDDLLIADAGAHCVRRVALTTLSTSTVAGRCDVAGFRDGVVVDALLSRPTHLLVVGSTIYFSDAGNHRVRRVGDGVVETVIGNGAASSQGDGSPARALPVESPGALAIDDDNNLFVASTTTVRQVANVDGDALPDGDDLVRTILRSSDVAGGLTCVEALARQGARLLVVDACRGRAFSVTSEVR